jgi:DNA-binding IclR family transcriptional regulator
LFSAGRTWEASVQVVVRALSILRALSGEQRGLAMGEIAERLDLPTASTHRILRVLEGERFVTRSSSNRRYFLGPAARELAPSDLARESPLVMPHEAVAAASRATGETVFLSELVGSGVVCLALAESKHPLRLFVRVGQEMPLHAAAAARVLLAGRPAAEARALLERRTPLVAFTDDTPSTVEQVMDRLEVIKKRGYDVCHSELDHNVWAIAAPVRSSTDDVVASVTLAAPMHRMADAAERERATHAVLEAAAAMSADLGWAAGGLDAAPAS